jgi:hypothetical protein
MWERGWGALSTEDWGKGILSKTVNKPGGLEKLWQEWKCTPSNQELESL